MTSYRIFGAELSPYSVKVRSWFRYKGIDHEWVVRSSTNNSEFNRHAQLPLVPLVLCPDGRALQDSTPIIETLEAEHPEPAIIPDDPALAFVSALLEEYADEWGNKHMFHYRWAYEPDQRSAAERIARIQLGGMWPSRIPLLGRFMRARIASAVRARMMPRRSFVGSHDGTQYQIERSFATLCELLQRHLADRPYVFGGRPALADFGLWGQMYNAWSDPTPRQLIERDFDGLIPWIERMLAPAGQGDWECWDSLGPTLAPLLREEVAELFLPWTRANAVALAAGEHEFSVVLQGREFSQRVQKYHARSYTALCRKYTEVADNGDLTAILADAGVTEYLADVLDNGGVGR